MKKGNDYSKILIWAALAVTVARYIGAFVASDVGKISGGWSLALTVLMAVSGIGMGFLDVLGLAYVFDGWRKALPQSGQKWSNRFKVLTGFVAGLFVVGLAILTPFTVSRIRSEGMSQVLIGFDWWWSLAVNLAPILIIGGVTFSQSGFVTIRQDGEQITSKKSSDKVPNFSDEISGNFPTNIHTDWRTLPAEDKEIVATLSTSEIQQKYRISERTARNWRNNALARSNGKSVEKIEE